MLFISKIKVEVIIKIYFIVLLGFMNPPILVDINKDGVVDLINAGYSDRTQAIDGETLAILWTFYKPGTETYS